MTTQKEAEEYSGFEQGPIRPPSEAYSLLIRVTRNCPWNRCTFCPVYKGSRFSIRPVTHVKKDIDTVHRYVEKIKGLADHSGTITRDQIQNASHEVRPGEIQAFQAALHWLAGGMSSIFIQDANSLLIKPPDLVEILTHLKNRFPWVDRVTSYARSHTVAHISDEDLKAMGEAGLNRIHIGLESGSDEVLKQAKKGVTKETQIKAGLKIKKTGIQLSEYVMPGLGGHALSEIHARETADALNRINPEFIRLRTLAIPNSVPLFDEYQTGGFEKCTDRMMVEEILLFIESLDGITSTLASDHILNLFQEVDGTLPQDKEKMLYPLKAFLQMEPEYQTFWQVGRRLGYFTYLKDMESPHRLAKVEKACNQMGITPDNVDDTVDELMKRFI